MVVTPRQLKTRFRQRALLGAERGVSLIEVLVAITILAVGLVALLGSFFVGQNSLSQSAKIAQATELAMQGIELYRSGAYPAATFSPGASAGEHYFVEDYGSIANAPGFKRVLIRREMPHPGAPRTFDLLRVAVLWRRGAQSGSDVRESTLDRSEYDPTQPNQNPAIVELVTLVYRAGS